MYAVEVCPLLVVSSPVDKHFDVVLVAHAEGAAKTCEGRQFAMRWDNQIYIEVRVVVVVDMVM